ANEMHVPLASRTERQLGRFSAVEEPRVYLRVGVDPHRSLRRVGGCNQPEHASLVGRWDCLLLVARTNAVALRRDPDLQKVSRLVLGQVELAMRHTRAGAHALHIARRNALYVADAVPMGELSGENVADDLHVAMRVLAEPTARRDPVLVDHAQVSP